MARYILENKSVGIKTHEILQEINAFDPLDGETVGMLRDNSTNEMYRMIVNRVGHKYYLSKYYQMLDRLGYIEP